MNLHNRWRRQREVFDQASKLEGAARREFLERECSDDLEMKHTIEALLDGFGDFEEADDDVSPATEEDAAVVPAAVAPVVTSAVAPDTSEPERAARAPEPGVAPSRSLLLPVALIASLLGLAVMTVLYVRADRARLAGVSELEEARAAADQLLAQLAAADARVGQAVRDRDRTLADLGEARRGHEEVIVELDLARGEAARLLSSVRSGLGTRETEELLLAAHTLAQSVAFRSEHTAEIVRALIEHYTACGQPAEVRRWRAQLASE